MMQEISSWEMEKLTYDELDAHKGFPLHAFCIELDSKHTTPKVIH